MRPFRCFAAAVAALALIGCDHAAQVPTADKVLLKSDLRTSLLVAPQVFEAGNVIEIDVTLKNMGDAPATLDFSSGCQLGMSISNASGGDVGPAMACTANLTRLHLEPGESKTTPFSWNGTQYDPATHTYTPLPPGDYRVAGFVVGYLSIEPATSQVTILPAQAH